MWQSDMMQPSKTRMKIAMVGAGNVATHIAKELARKGMPPVQVWSRSMESARALASLVGCHATADVNDIVDDADFYIVSVCDSAMANVIASLCEIRKKGVFLHTAGTMSMNLFKGHCSHYGVMYPMQTFSKEKSLEFGRIPCFVEASDGETLAQVRQLALALTPLVYDLAEKDRKWLHVAAVFACNFSNACCAMAADILQKHGLDFSVMLPLVDEMAAKLHGLSPLDAQTGPAVRSDHNVMNEHLDMLANDAAIRDIYKAMSDVIIGMHGGKALK